MNLQVSSADDRWVSCARANLQNSGASIRNADVEQVITAPGFEIVHGASDKRHRNCLIRVAADSAQDSFAVEVDNIYVYFW